MARTEVTPVLLGPANCEAACGMPWRHVRDHARALGVAPVRVGRKLAVPAVAFLEALTRSTPPASDVANDADDPAETIRRTIGKRRRV